jgi:hypothetical protein
VQHFILEMMRRIMEQASYDFATRVIPKTLHDNGWACSEMVELSMWRDTLLRDVPQPALKLASGYSLQKALSDAVRIRNSASHRHLCDNIELQKMATQAMHLMVIYGDTVRHDKLKWLWDELKEWDGVNDSLARRAQLEVCRF